MVVYQEWYKATMDGLESRLERLEESFSSEVKRFRSRLLHANTSEILQIGKEVRQLEEMMVVR